MYMLTNQNVESVQDLKLLSYVACTDVRTHIQCMCSQRDRLSHSDKFMPYAFSCRSGLSDNIRLGVESVQDLKLLFYVA